MSSFSLLAVASACIEIIFRSGGRDALMLFFLDLAGRYNSLPQDHVSAIFGVAHGVFILHSLLFQIERNTTVIWLNTSYTEIPITK